MVILLSTPLAEAIWYTVYPAVWILEKLSRYWILKVKWAVRHATMETLLAAHLQLAGRNYVHLEYWSPDFAFLKYWYSDSDLALYYLMNYCGSIELLEIIRSEIARRDQREAREQVEIVKLNRFLRMFGPTNHWESQITIRP